MGNCRPLTPDEKDFAKQFLGRRTDDFIATLMKRRASLVCDLRNSLGIPPVQNGRGPAKAPTRIVLCHRCGVVKFESPLDKDKQPTRIICGPCREEMTAC